MSRRERRQTESGNDLVDLEDVPDVLDPTSGTATGRVSVSSLLVEEDPEAFQRFLEEEGIDIESMDVALPTEDDTEPADEPESPPTSIEDLTQDADPQQFDRTFLDSDANLTIQGGFDPVAGDKQVLPRIAYVLNFNLVYNPDTERWEPKKKGNIVIEDFEEGQLVDYLQTFNASVTTDRPLFGDFSLKLEGRFGGRAYTEKTPRPEPGDSFSVYWYNNDGLDQFIGWGGVDGTDFQKGGYVAEQDNSQPWFAIRKFRNGSQVKTVADNTTLPTDEWLYIRVDWNNAEADVGGGENIRARAFDIDGNNEPDTLLADVATSDTEFEGPAWGHRVGHSNGGDPAFFDQWEIL